VVSACWVPAVSACRAHTDAAVGAHRLPGPCTLSPTPRRLLYPTPCPHPRSWIREWLAPAGPRQSVRAAHTLMWRWGHTDYLARVMLLPRGGGCFAILYHNAYYFMLTLVTLPLWGVEGILYFRPVCTTRQYNIVLLY